jgi:ribonuclease D
MPDNFKRKISKAEVNECPLFRFEGPIVMVQTEAEAEAAAARLSAVPFIGIDTETRPAFKKGQSYQVALLQLAVDDTAYLLRLNQVGLLGPIKDVLENRDVAKIGIAPRDDMKELRAFAPVEPRNIVDLNRVCKELGFESIGARKLTALVLGQRISKRQQLSNWEQPLLTPQQCSYAATDAWVCQAIYRRLQES